MKTIAYRGAGAAYAPTAATTSVTGVAVPSGVQPLDTLLWVIAGNTAYAGGTPPGWVPMVDSSNVGSTASGAVTIFSRVATGAETATYTKTTGGSGKWVSWIVGYSGVDTATPLDTAAIANATTAPPSITTVTANAWVLTFGRVTTASGVTGTVWSSTTGTVRASGTNNISATTNTSAGMADQIRATPGTVTPTLTAGGTNTVNVRMTLALRPAADDFFGWGVPV